MESRLYCKKRFLDLVHRSNSIIRLVDDDESVHKLFAAFRLTLVLVTAVIFPATFDVFAGNERVQLFDITNSTLRDNNVQK